MHGGLLVAHQDVAEIRVLLQRLTDPTHVAVPEDAQDTGEEGVLVSITLNILVFKKANDGLSGRQLESAHNLLLLQVNSDFEV
jgi:hypothetical protein